MSNASVTQWMHDLRRGDEYAASRLWDSLRTRLMQLARGTMKGNVPRGYDEEDVALSAFAKLVQSLQIGSYEELAGRGELWKLVATIALNKARDRAREENRQRRGGNVTHQPMNNDLAAVLTSATEDPASVALVQEECRRLISQLDEPNLQLVALLKVEGFTNVEIAKRLDCTQRSVYRRLNLIREIWSGGLS